PAYSSFHPFGPSPCPVALLLRPLLTPAQRSGRFIPHIRFLFVVPRLRIGLPPDPASRRRPCPSPCLRLRENLALGLAPRKWHIMPGTHVATKLQC
ncbi:MAG: hypothetical protein AB1756_00205, partial [Acidobacteriota bacterium]